MELLKLLESIRGDALTFINLIFSKLGEELIIFAVLCLIYWCIDKRLGYRIAFSYLVSGFIVNSLKIIIKVPRPFIKDTSFTPVEKALEHATGYSFPSGHTQSATSVYGTISMYLGKRSILLGILFFIPILAVGFSRMYLGVHTPWDVMAGFAIGLLVTIVISYLFDNYWLDPTHYRIILVVVTIAGFALMLLGAYEMAYENVAPVNGLDCFKIGSAMLGFIFGWYIEITQVKFVERGISVKGQIIKYICGMIGVALCYKGTEFVLLLFMSENNLIVNVIPYFLTTFWVTGIYPVIIKKVFTSPFNYRTHS